MAMARQSHVPLEACNHDAPQLHRNRNYTHRQNSDRIGNVLTDQATKKFPETLEKALGQAPSSFGRGYIVKWMELLEKNAIRSWVHRSDLVLY